MLYLKSLVMDKFKSFKHAELLFNKGFTCVVGPNGSGKSNTCDALLFGLGESSLRRIRVRKLDDLIMLGPKKRDLSKAYIKAEFAGDEEMTILRAIRADGKTLYKVNGKKTTRQDVTEILKRHNIHIDETSTIAQGEIQAISDMNAKERRELIDIAAGIKEFEVKKGEAMRELEKVTAKVNEANIMLHERGAILDELQKDKEAAEKYLSMKTRLTALNYSILVSKKEDAQAQFESLTKDTASLESKSKELQAKVDGLSQKVDQLSAARTDASKELEASSKNAGETRAKLEEINKELATIAVELENFKATVEAGEKSARSFDDESKKAKVTIEANAAKIDDIKKALAQVEKQIAGSKANTETERDDAEKRVKSLEETVSGLETRTGTVNGHMGMLNTELTLSRARKEDLEKSVEATGKKNSDKKKSKEEQAKLISKLSIQSAEKQTEIKAAETDTKRMEKEMEAIDTKLIELKEQRFAAAATDRGSSDRLKGAFTEKDGFYGRAGELCTYTQDDAIAIETAAGARFDYLVVDSISTANKIIEYLKKNELGRATFIPIKDIRADESEPSKEKGLKAVIELIAFERKFAKVFGYIFGNTYLIDNIESSKRHGVGRHRYVTAAGELVEQSGIVSGGQSKRRLSVSLIDGQLKAMSKQKDELRAASNATSTKLYSLRKELAGIEMDLAAARTVVARLDAELDDISDSSKSAASDLKDLNSKIEKAEKEMITLDKEKLTLMDQLADAKKELNKFYSESIKASQEMAKHGASKAEREKLEKLRDEAQTHKIKMAELVKENEMLEQKASEHSMQASDAKKSVEQAKKSTSEKKLRSEILEKAKEEIEKEMGHSGKASKKALAKIGEIDEEIKEHSTAKGKSGMELENVGKQLIEAKTKKAYSENRLKDLTVELVNYKAEEIERVKDKTEDMEREAAIIGSKINELGNVNLKAPELYDQKKKDVDEVASKVDTLKTEQQAVMRMIEEIDSKKYETFMDTFNAINKNFSKLYAYFSPLPATIELDDPKDPLSGGLEIKIKNGNSHKRVDSMSGGEKAQMLLSLIFAIHLCKPSSLYIFDEVDAALDKENSKKLSLLIKDMSKTAQFVVVSHNDSLIVNADTAIGVVKANGESKAVGLEISNYIAK